MITASSHRKSFTSRFKEHLSMTFPLESSRFSPDSPPPPLRTVSPLFDSSFSPSGRDVPRDIDSFNGSYRPDKRATLRDRFTRIFFDLRTFEDRDMEAQNVRIQAATPELPQWQPLHVEKKPQLSSPHRKSMQKKRWWIVLLLIVLAALIGNVIFLNVRILSMTNPPAPASPKPSSIPSTTSDADQCISQFTLNAPANASAYPCGSCLPILAGVSSSDAQDYQQAANAIQFCGLRAIFESANSDGQKALTTGGWSADVDFCTWTGVSCTSGNVTSLQLTFPGVPASVPAELGNLASLQSLQVIGNGIAPAGSVPSSFHNLTSLTTLHLESTAITTFPDDLFSSLTKVSNLTIISNAQLSSDITPIVNLSLQRLKIQRQSIGNPLPDLVSSKTLQSSLISLDLTGDGLTGTIPSGISSLSALTELHLDGNNFQAPLPTSFPATLQILTMSNNAALSGQLPSSLCSSKTLTACNLTGTGLGSNGGCGVCQF